MGVDAVDTRDTVLGFVRPLHATRPTSSPRVGTSPLLAVGPRQPFNATEMARAINQYPWLSGWILGPYGQCWHIQVNVHT